MNDSFVPMIPICEKDDVRYHKLSLALILVKIAWGKFCKCSFLGTKGGQDFVFKKWSLF